VDYIASSKAIGIPMKLKWSRHFDP
jgi:hypothetical protein